MTALSEDNVRLRRSNSMLMSELTHMKRLYNDIIYFVQNHVKPVAPSNSYPSSFLLCNGNNNNSNNNTIISGGNNNNASALVQKPLNQLLSGYYPSRNNNGNAAVADYSSPGYISSRSPLTVLEEHDVSRNNNDNNNNNTKLFGVSIRSPSSKKRLHPEYGSAVEASKARLVLEKDDLVLNLMPPSTC